ncbi:MAG: GNAT family N-acetyltransferase, partial [Lysobacterales bacterium]
VTTSYEVTENVTPPKADGLRVREATEADVPLIHAMLLELAKATKSVDDILSTPEDLAREGFGTSPAFDALIAEMSGQPVGLALYFQEFSSWRGRRGIYLQDLFVSPEQRGEGIGRILIQELAVRAVEEGATYLRLAVDSNNGGAAAFYRKLGFIYREERLFDLSGVAFENFLPAP